jgi:hypothetical protein
MTVELYSKLWNYIDKFMKATAVTFSKHILHILCLIVCWPKGISSRCLAKNSRLFSWSFRVSNIRVSYTTSFRFCCVVFNSHQFNAYCCSTHAIFSDKCSIFRRWVICLQMFTVYEVITCLALPLAISSNNEPELRLNSCRIE